MTLPCPTSKSTLFTTLDKMLTHVLIVGSWNLLPAGMVKMAWNFLLH